MNQPTTAAPPASTTWQGPGSPDDESLSFTWQRFLWALVFPVRRHRISMTVSGLFLIMLAMGIGTAAYNTASNILFITLSLLLACLLLSGLMSWFNFMGVCWRFRPLAAWRAGHETLVTVELENRKKWLPTYGLWFDFVVQPKRPAEVVRGGDEPDVRAVLAAFEKDVVRGRLFTRERLEPTGAATVEWAHKPARRGEATVALAAVGSFFPFGFLRKNIGTSLKQPVLIWPAQVEYQWSGAAAAQGGSQGRRTVQAGTGEDLLALRKYSQGDSHRLIHWKASARLGQLMVRQFAAESLDGYALDVSVGAEAWPRPEQFELLCSFAATFAEDLFAAGRLLAVRVGGGGWHETRRMRDLEAFFDELALLQPNRSEAPAGESAAAFRRNVITFSASGARGVTAHVNGVATASA
ncbi:MAG TPA: DUF58 domain-containing protein [Candidatus Didemnitutus sp.]|nr:DUF58 domain-containing protein [Candidatus Didemnitutus sp.]